MADAEYRDLVKSLGPRARYWLSPRFVDFLVESREFTRRHQLRTPAWAQVLAYRKARKYGLDLLPPTPLDGLVVDIGANVGEFTDVMLKVEPRAHVVAFEPSPAIFQRLQRRFGQDPRVTLDARAVAGSHGQSRLHVTSGSVFSSLRAPTESLEEMYGRGARVVEEAVVDTVALDDVISEPITLLKIDAQGGEREILAGAARSLTQTSVLLTEVNFTSHYTGEASFTELHTLIEEAGFALVGLGDPVRDPTCRLLWADACYARRL